MSKDLEYIQGVSYTPNTEIQYIARLVSGCGHVPWEAGEALHSLDLKENVQLSTVHTNYMGNLFQDSEPARERFEEGPFNIMNKYPWKKDADEAYKIKVEGLLADCNVDYGVWKNYVFDNEWEKGRKYYDEVFKANPRKLLHERIKKEIWNTPWKTPYRENWMQENLNWDRRQALHQVNLGGFEVRVVNGEVVRENAYDV